MTYREKKIRKKVYGGASTADLKREGLRPAAPGRHENRASAPQKSKFLEKRNIYQR